MLGTEDELILVSMSEIGVALNSQGRYTEAEKLREQVMETTKKVLGAEHLDTLTSIGNLALTYWKQGRWEEAEKLKVQELGTRKKVLKAEHPDTLGALVRRLDSRARHGGGA